MVSVIIPIFNKIEVVERCIQLNIDHAHGACEWIIIDNNSDAPTKEGILRLQAYVEKREGHTFKLKTESINTGVAAAWNTGLSMSTGVWICILNNDCVMMPGWDEALKANDYQFDIYSPFVIEEMVMPKYTLSEFLEGSKNWRYIEKINRSNYREGLFGGVVLFGKRTIFDQIGAFDEIFWLSLEDMDFLWRAILNEFKIGVVGAVVAHHRSGSTRRNIDFDHKANQYKFESKWGWNFEKNENRFWQRRKHSFNKFLLKYFFVLGRLNPLMP